MLCKTGTKLKGLFIIREEGLSSTIASQHRINNLEVRILGFGFGLILKAKFLSLS